MSNFKADLVEIRKLLEKHGPFPNYHEGEYSEISDENDPYFCTILVKRKDGSLIATMPRDARNDIQEARFKI